MKVCGIIIAKEHSARFPGKNYFEIDGIPMFWHGVRVIKKYLFDVYVATDSDEIRNYCVKNDVNYIWRGPNVSRDNEPFFSVLKFAYQSLSEKYDIIIAIAANSINHDMGAIADGIYIMQMQPDVSEIRSFDSNGNQSGIFIFRNSVFEKEAMVLNHMASVISNGKEIHYREDI